MKKVLIADDHSVVRYGLRILLAQSFPTHEIFESWDAASVKLEMKKKNFELILLDLNMPETDPNALIQWIKTQSPETKILIISMNDENLFGKRLLQIGADGYLIKNAPSEELLKAIRVIMNGEKYISMNLTNLIVSETISGSSHNPFDLLTPREFQVATYMMQDYSLSQISELLNVQYSTASTFKQRIYEKLHVDDRRGFLELASVHGFRKV